MLSVGRPDGFRVDGVVVGEACRSRGFGCGGGVGFGQPCGVGCVVADELQGGPAVRAGRASPCQIAGELGWGHCCGAADGIAVVEGAGLEQRARGGGQWLAAIACVDQAAGVEHSCEQERRVPVGIAAGVREHSSGVAAALGGSGPLRVSRERGAVAGCGQACGVGCVVADELQGGPAVRAGRASPCQIAGELGWGHCCGAADGIAVVEGAGLEQRARGGGQWLAAIACVDQAAGVEHSCEQERRVQVRLAAGVHQHSSGFAAANRHRRRGRRLGSNSPHRHKNAAHSQRRRSRRRAPHATVPAAPVTSQKRCRGRGGISAGGHDVIAAGHDRAL